MFCVWVQKVNLNSTPSPCFVTGSILRRHLIVMIPASDSQSPVTTHRSGHQSSTDNPRFHQCVTAPHHTDPPCIIPSSHNTVYTGVHNTLQLSVQCLRVFTLGQTVMMIPVLLLEPWNNVWLSEVPPDTIRRRVTSSESYDTQPDHSDWQRRGGGR